MIWTLSPFLISIGLLEVVGFAPYLLLTSSCAAFISASVYPSAFNLLNLSVPFPYFPAWIASANSFVDNLVGCTGAGVGSFFCSTITLSFAHPKLPLSSKYGFLAPLIIFVIVPVVLAGFNFLVEFEAV